MTFWDRSIKLDLFIFLHHLYRTFFLTILVVFWFGYCLCVFVLGGDGAPLPDEAVWAGGRCGLFGWRSEGSFILLTKCVYGWVVIWCGSSAALRSGLAAHWLHPRTTAKRSDLNTCLYATTLNSVSWCIPWAGVVAQLVHVWVVLCHDCDGVTLLTYDKTRLLLGGITQVYPIILRQIKHRKVTKQPQLKSPTLSSEQKLCIQNHCKWWITSDNLYWPQVAGLHTPGLPGEQCCLQSPWIQRYRHSHHWRWRCPEVRRLCEQSRSSAPPDTAFRSTDVTSGVTIRYQLFHLEQWIPTPVVQSVWYSPLI